VTRYPKASDISSPPCLLRLLPAGANRRVGLAPTGKRRLVTAHTHSGHSPVLLDDLVGAGEDLIWDGEAESLRGLQVDYQVELGWLLER